MFATISRSVSLWPSRRCSSSIRLPVNRYRLSFCTAPFVRRVLASVIHHRYGTITIFCRPITRSSRTKGNRETTGVATLSRLFSISSSQGCSVFLRRSVEFKGMKYRSFYFFLPPTIRLPSRLCPFRFRRVLHVFSTFRDQIPSIEYVCLRLRFETR